MDLASTQNLLLAMIMGLGEADDLDVVSRLIVSDDRASALQRLAVYRRSFVARLQAVMKAQFPVSHATLGEEIFRQFTEKYLLQVPPTSYTLGDLGAGLADFLQMDRPDKNGGQREAWIDFLVALVRFEWSINLIFDAPADPATSIAGEDESLAILSKATNVTLFAEDYPLIAYHRACLNGDDPLIPAPQKNWFAVMRINYKLRSVPLTQDQYFELEKRSSAR
jgi:hypothetical protein